ncbi:MAG: hypothetical protein KF797_06390 [Flavobacteriales bacterium]|nr:hypothetical protein [Flavobacteriales bacterium]
MSKGISSTFFIIGVLLLAIGVFLYLSWWCFPYGMGAVAFGAILVLVSKQGWKTKTLVAGVPVLFVSWSFAMTFSPEQTILIPADYHGMFAIVYGEPCGMPSTKEDGRYIIRIPQEGVAIVQREFHSGWVDDAYYFEAPQGERIKVSEVISYPPQPKQGRVVMLGSSGAIPASMPNGNSSTDAPEAYRFTQFHVLDTDSLIEPTFKEEGALHAKMMSSVQHCRASVEGGRNK